ncbi:MAG: hypothetical protein WBG30_14020 [Psychrilyobacter sp.]|uniref:hypothetical protein n=1 Tax=Psychrilyobacter sp. TaxID=2586924 RepID=UPI003C75CAC3
MKKLILFFLMTTLAFSQTYIKEISNDLVDGVQVINIEVYVEKDKYYEVYPLVEKITKDNISIYYENNKIYEKIEVKDKTIERSFMSGNEILEVQEYPVKEIIIAPKYITKKYTEKNHKKSSTFDKYIKLICSKSLLMDYNIKNTEKLMEIFPDRGSRTIREVRKS